MTGLRALGFAERLRGSRVDAQVVGGKPAGEPIQVRFAQFDLELLFLHEPILQANASFPVSERGLA